MSFFSRKKISTSNSAPENGLTSQSFQQLPPRQLPFPFESPLHYPHPAPDHPWSVLRLNPAFLSKNAPPSPFPRFGHASPATATATGELFVYGGLAHNAIRDDLYMFSTRDLSTTLLQTSGEFPGPRFRPAAALVSSVLLIWGGVTKFDDKGEPKGPYDDSLYLLSLASRVWTRVARNGPGPVGRCRHAVTMVGSKLFIFGGQVDGKFLNDLWALDLNSLQLNPVWDSYEPAPGDKKPPPRIGHVLVSTGDCIILFGGSDGRYHYDDTWSFDISTRKWTELECTGHIPSPRRGHAAALVDDVMYIFGGRGVDGANLGDLTAFKLSTQRWFTFQNMGPSPSRGSGHAMVSDGTRVFVLGGPSGDVQADGTIFIHVLDTKRINHPNTSAGPVTQEQPQHPMSSPSYAYAAHGASPFQNATSEDLGRLVSPQITRARNPSPSGLPSQHTGVGPRRVLEGGDVGEGSAKYRAKFAVPDASSVGEFAHLERELVELEGQLVELEGHLSAPLAVQKERDQRLAQLTEEFAWKSSLLEQAEANAAEAAKRAGLKPREHADRLPVQTSLVVQKKDAELVNTHAKFDELLLSRDQHVRALEQQIGRYETELAGVRAELDAKKSELEAVRLRLTDAEIGWAKSKAEADTLRALTTAGLVSSTGMDEERMTRGLLERIRAMEAEMADMRWSEKSLEALETRNEG